MPHGTPLIVGKPKLPSLLLWPDDWPVPYYEVAWRRRARVGLCIRYCRRGLSVYGVDTHLLIVLRNYRRSVIAADVPEESVAVMTIR